MNAWHIEYNFHLIELLATGILLLMVLLESARTRRSSYYLLSGVLTVVFFRATLYLLFTRPDTSLISTDYLAIFYFTNMLSFIVYILLGPAVLSKYIANMSRVKKTIISLVMIFSLLNASLFFSNSIISTVSIRDISIIFSIIFSLELIFPLLALSVRDNFFFKLSGIDPSRKIDDANFLKIPFASLLLSQLAYIASSLEFIGYSSVFLIIAWGMPALAFVSLLLVVYREIIDELHEHYNEAIHDKLTGLFNYSYLMKNIDIEISRANRYQRTLSFLMIDMDHFKKYNDTYGHIEGDRLLADVSEIFKNSARETDLAFRYGGEEFSILLPETSAEQAKVLAERIKVKINRLRREPVISASIGISSLTDFSLNEDYSSRALLLDADKALYEAKNSGRNKIVVSTSSNDSIFAKTKRIILDSENFSLGKTEPML